MNDSQHAFLRRTYARTVAFASGADDPRLEAAFAEVRREDFLGPGPWDIPLGEGYRRTPDADLMWLYQNQLVGIVPAKGLNNGHPSFLALLISLMRLEPGDHAVHIGAGVGYFTAIVATLVGASGRVSAIEYEPDLAARAEANLAPWPQARVRQGDGAALPLEAADAILVNAGASRPADVWLDALRDGGRLVLPLTAGYDGPGGIRMSRGAVFLVEREGGSYRAVSKSPVAIYPCAGLADPDSEECLRAAFKKGGVEKVRRLHRGQPPSAETVWASGPGWALAYE